MTVYTQILKDKLITCLELSIYSTIVAYKEVISTNQLNLSPEYFTGNYKVHCTREIPAEVVHKPDYPNLATRSTIVLAATKDAELA